MEMAVHHELRAAQVRGQIILAPEASRGAGKHGFGVHTVAAHLLRQADDAVEIGAGRLGLLLTLAFVLQLMHRLARQILSKDHFFFVGFIAWRQGLKVKTESAGSFVFKLC